jgi:MoaA/NifB/PqqE/SkfB family radical SAM enzyme
MEKDASPKRVIINFTKKCALNCEWCYVPFDKKDISGERLVSVIERVSELGFSSVTFGGGDPFQFRDLASAIIKAKKLGLFVHVDTHAITLSKSKENSYLLDNYIDLIGLPLDGSTDKVHDLMRDRIGHYDLIIDKLAWLRNHEVLIKLNTMVSSVNEFDLANLGKLVQKIHPDRWSIYQYWAVGPAVKAQSNHMLEHDAFLESVRRLNSKAIDGVVVEINTSESRRGTYPILNHLGEVHFHHEYPTNEFKYVGSIFEREISSKMDELCSGEREQAVSRYDATKKYRVKS